MRFLVRKFIHRHRRSLNSLRHVIIVGTNDRAIALAKRIDADLDGTCHLVGFVDQKWRGEEGLRLTGHSIVSDFDSFQEFLRDRVVDEVIICTPLKSLYEWSSRIFDQCEQQGIKVLYGADLFTPQIGHPCAEQLGDQPMLMSDTCRQTGVEALIKRFADICIAALAVVAFVPIMIAVAAAIKFNSPGPALFMQERVGFNKRRFRLYKFRTMVNDAEQRLPGLERLNEVTGPVFKIGRDPRVTTVGRFLRKSSLDELPQLFNVLKGDMSLVGPRPLAVRDYRGITEDWQRRRLSVRPGMTCLWQILGRSSIPFERWMELDLEYIDKWSLGLDLEILFRTFPAVLKGTGAS
jgi:exopolysaccharide biosynthesis polyprenyl glycosylphosphotransferase